MNTFLNSNYITQIWNRNNKPFFLFTSGPGESVLDASLVDTQHYKVQIKGKWSNPRKGVLIHLGVVAIKKETFGLLLTTNNRSRMFKNVLIFSFHLITHKLWWRSKNQKHLTFTNISCIKSSAEDIEFFVNFSTISYIYIYIYCHL